MPIKRKGSGLKRKRKEPQKLKKGKPEAVAEEPALSVVNEECLPERLPDEEFFVNDDTQNILQATSDDCPTINAMATRLAIAYYYLKVLVAPPPEEGDGADGTVVEIRNSLKIKRNSHGRVREIISQVHHCHCVELRYTGERNSDGGLGRKVIIKKTSVEAQIIVDAVEDGMSMAMAHALVNKHCYEAEQDPYYLSAIRTLILSLDPVVSPLVKLKQGDTDPDSAWSRARYNWVLQLLIRFGLFVYLGKNDTVVVPPNTADPNSNNINDDLIIGSTVATYS
jgi:hypothetical protein